MLSSSSLSSAAVAPSLANLDLAKFEKLASVAFKQGRFQEAEEMLKKCLCIREQLLGSDNPDTLTTLNNLAATTGRNGKYIEAEKLFRKALLVREATLGSNHVDTLTTVNHLGVLLKQRGILAESEQCFERALHGFKECQGENSFLYSEAAYNLAILSVQKGHRRKARTLFSTAHKSLAFVLGAEHQHTVDALYWEVKCFNQDNFDNDNGGSSNNQSSDDENIYISKNEWMYKKSCDLCKAIYTLLRRQHHCRVCSRSVCHDCSTGKSIVYEFDKLSPVRICSACTQQGF